MLTRRWFFFHLFFALSGFFSSLQITDGNEANSHSTRSGAGKTFFLHQRLRYPRDCAEVLDQCPGKNLSGVFVIQPEGYLYPFEVYCTNSVDASGWTVIMRRLDGSLVFSRNWREYKKGFGFLSREFWIGNDKLSSLTNQKKYELRIDITISNGSQAFLIYSDFSVTDEKGNYSISTLGDATGNTDFLAPPCPNNMIIGYAGDGRNCTCDTGYIADESSCRRPRDCDEVPSVKGYSGSGLYYILPSNWREFQVYCNMSEGRWTVFQRRIPSTGRTFFLGWNSYKMGFGELEEDFWLGNDKIHHLTNQGNYELRIDITDSGNRHYIARYNGFRIGDEESKYRMTILGRYSGSAGYDAMRSHLNQPFTTRDQDNDDWDGSNCHYRYFDDSCENHRSSHNCAFLHEGAWWYKDRGAISRGGCDRSTTYSYCNNHQCNYKTCCDDRNCNRCGILKFSCAFSNLNGPQRGPKGKSIIWHGLAGNDCGIKFTEMKLRPI